ncbi:hypothetical protein FHW69_001099 [Luteibacter sp. Sphag1AF]|uniref:hypothetical protein n=1 Tax=Luteibacter sp. Sphag1AF TaxID=2587031 RepID=UPI0016177639|nr:hypothetical protein [Luteibacter sp. Sphag1AF]MBB3226509.1 hypothetical protein [Luteibacter sp. Sphag1AF]
MKQAAGLLLAVLAPVAGMAHADERTLMPAVYEAGHFYVTPTLPDGRTLRLLVDTGGPGGGNGLFPLYRHAADAHQLAVSPCGHGDEAMNVAGAGVFGGDARIPLVAGTPCGAAAFVLDKGILVDGEDGILGAGYLPRFTWTLDYPAKKMWREPVHWKATESSTNHRADLGLQRNGAGHVAGLVRIDMRVDGQVIPMLLDTGATARPTPAGAKASGTPTVRGVGVTSYVITSTLDRWHAAHPEWRIVTDGDNLLGHGTRLIEVPQVNVAGWTVGPVWFTERPDSAFRALDDYVDRPLQGAMGGNVFGHFVLTLDYAHAAAWFRCASGCQPTTGR